MTILRKRKGWSKTCTLSTDEADEARTLDVCSIAMSVYEAHHYEKEKMKEKAEEICQITCSRNTDLEQVGSGKVFAGSSLRAKLIVTFATLSGDKIFR